MGVDNEGRHAAECDKNPRCKASVPKESVDHESDSSVETAYKCCANGKQSREMERCHESHFDRFDPPSYSYPRSKYGPRKATDRWREARRSSEAERARWLQARRDGQGD